MSTLTFQADEVRRAVEHSIQAPTQRQYAVDYDATKGEMVYAKPEAPAVLLVHDHGVYLMSNGEPADTLYHASQTTQRYVAYAKTCHPERDPDYYENARALVGGDDFAECLPWAREIKDQIDGGAKRIAFKFTQRGIELLPQKGGRP